MSSYGPYKIFVFDTGTTVSRTGLNVDTDRILQMALVSLHGSSNHFHVAVDNGPGEFTRAFRKMEEHIQKVNTRNQTPVLVTHNVEFDAKMLLQELRRNNIDIPESWLFTGSFEMAKHFLGYRVRCRLEDLAPKFGVSVRNARDCSEDVVVLRSVLREFENSRRSRNIADLLFNSAKPLRNAARGEAAFYAGRDDGDDDDDEEETRRSLPLNTNDYASSSTTVDHAISAELSSLQTDAEPRYIIVPNFGRRYHYRRNCRGLRKAQTKLKVTFEDIPAEQRTPCGLCFRAAQP